MIPILVLLPHLRMHLLLDLLLNLLLDLLLHLQKQHQQMRQAAISDQAYVVHPGPSNVRIVSVPSIVLSGLLSIGPLPTNHG